MTTHYYRTEDGQHLSLDEPVTRIGWTKLTAAQYRTGRQAECIAQLSRMCPAGSTVYTILRHASASGMSRRITLVVFRGGEPLYLDAYVADLLGYKRHPDQGIIVSGCGMDMGFHSVDSLSRALCVDLTHRWL